MSKKSEQALILEAGLTAAGWVPHPLPQDGSVLRFLGAEGSQARRDGLRMFVTRSGQLKKGMSPGGAMKASPAERDEWLDRGRKAMEATDGN